MSGIDALLAGESDEAELRDVFTLRHPTYRSKVECYTDRKGREIHIRGRFVGAEAQPVGHFFRRIRKNGGRWTAVHERIFVEEPFRRQGIALAHYRAALRYYVYRLNAAYVQMQADDMGPFVWPGFGFEFSEDKDAIREELARSSYPETGRDEDLPTRAFEIVAFPRLDSPEMGIEAIKAVADRLKATMPMILNLEDPVTLHYLREIDILDRL